MDKCLNCGNPVESEGLRNKKFCKDSCRYDFHNKKKKKWTLKKLAKHYQETGEYLPEAESAEEIYIMSIADKIEESFKSYVATDDFFKDKFPMTLDNFISIEIGTWQVTHKFYRKYNDSDIDTLIKKVKDKHETNCNS